MENNCENLKVIPQSLNNDWFNCFLMSILYSQNARKIMIKYSENWDKDDKFYNIIKYILKNNHKPSIEKFYKKNKPELLLYKFLYRNKLKLKDNIKYKINKKENYQYYQSFLKKINPKILDIFYDYKNDIYNLNNYKYFENPNLENNFDFSEIEKCINDIPDFIILYHSNLININSFYTYVIRENYKTININGIKNYENIITLNDIQYKLDSCILNNNVVGITCNDKRYIYKNNCHLIDHNWDLNNKQKFSINNKCELDIDDLNNDLSFSFGIDDRILVYVRIENYINTSKLSLIDENKLQLSRIDDIIDEYYKIHIFSIEELKEHLLYFILMDYDENSKDKLDEYLSNFFNDKTKKDLEYLLYKNFKKHFDNNNIINYIENNENENYNIPIENDFCKTLKVIPQIVGSCWFNAILMSVLYSQNARKMIINESVNWDKDDKFFNILKYILNNNYDNPLIKKYFNHLKPELLLFLFLKKFDKEIETKIKEKIKKDFLDFGWYAEYIIFFIKKLTPKVLDICYFQDKILINYYKNYYDYNLNGKSFDNINEKLLLNFENEKNEIIKIINDIPDFIILYHYELITFFNDNFLFRYLSNKLKYIFDLSSYNINFNGLKEYEDIITFNGIKYKLDSCLLNNYNKEAHAICGITCNNNKYVYNGWLNISKYFSPCSLIKYDWNLRRDDEFCLNVKKCKLDFVINKKNLCFSFNKGNRVLIYVRINNNETRDLTPINTSKVKLTDINTIVNDIYQINDIDNNETFYKKIKNNLMKSVKKTFIKSNYEMKTKENWFKNKYLKYIMNKLKII